MSGTDLFNCPVRFVKRRRQRYIRIRVKPDEVLVSAPYGTPNSEMERFLSEKQEWVAANLEKLNEKQTGISQRNRFKEGFVLYEGEWYPIAISSTAGPLTIRLADEGFVACLNPGAGPEEEQVARLYALWANNRLRARFAALAKEKGFRHGRVTVRNQKTKWGSCSSKGNISLNWRLIKCPRFVQDYIYIHEMCHLVHLNHSPQYWALVDAIYPDRDKADRWIKEHGPLAFQNP